MISTKYKAFTLTEMLVVMGILVILIVLGVAVGRVAMDRSNEIEHKNGATKLYQAAQSYYTDNKEFPDDETPIEEIIKTGDLKDYLDMGTFNGGSEASYYYFTNEAKQAVLICVTLGGRGDENQKGVICVGNGFNEPSIEGVGGLIVNEKLDPKVDLVVYDEIIKNYEKRSDWGGREIGWVPVPEDPKAPADEYDPCYPCGNPPKGGNCITGVPSYCFAEDDNPDEGFVPIEKPIPVEPVQPIDPTDPCAPCVENPKLGIYCPDVVPPECM